MRKPITFVAFFVMLLPVSVTGQQSNTSAPGGVRNSIGPRRLNERQLHTLQESLRHKTGFLELAFDPQGVLTLGNRQHIEGGSATARALLVAAVESANLYELESHERSPEIAFAQIHVSTDRLIRATGQQTTIHQVQLDFADFHWLRGDSKAIAAFDPGFVFLHELAHGVLKLHDPQGEMEQLGDCDTHVNQMRRELRLPERLSFYPRMTMLPISAGLCLVQAELVFVERPAANARPTAQYSLTWLPRQVSPDALKKLNQFLSQQLE